jgi:hypothetical protein
MLKRIFGFSVLAIVLFAGLALVQETGKFTADRHAEKGLACSVCHGDGAPSSDVKVEKCLACHQSIEAVAEKAKNYDKDPHKNHLIDATDVKCTQCHNGHKATKPVCLDCHSGMKFEKADAN